jgi:hypothetical protein
MSDNQCLICHGTKDLLDAHSGTRPYQHLYHLSCVRERINETHKLECIICSDSFAPRFIRKLITGQPKKFIKKCFDVIYSTGNKELLTEFLSDDKQLFNSALIEASKDGELDMIKFVLHNGPPIHACILEDASNDGSIEMIKPLFDHKGGDIYLRNDETLRKASRRGRLRAMKVQPTNHADMHIYNDLPLRNACQNGHLEAVRFLLDHGADMTARGDYESNHDADNALGAASRNGHLEIVKLLLHRGADVHADSDYALRVASENHHKAVLKLLKSKACHHA